MPKEGIIVRTIIFSIFFFILFANVITRIYQVQIERHEELLSKAKNKYVRTIKQKGERGKIFDIHGNLLATNEPCYDISADPSSKSFEKTEDCEEIASFLANASGSDKDKTLKRLTEKYTHDGRIKKFAPVCSKVNLETKEKIRKYCEEKKIKGVSYKETTKRFYPNDHALIHIIGFVNEEQGEEIPQYGVEKIKQRSIKASDGEIRIEQDRKGRSIEQNILEQCRDGNDIYLTISLPIQMIVEEEIDRIYAKYDPKGAFIVVANPKNGNIMAIAQRPTFNPNDRSTIIDSNVIRDKIISEAFEPGSIMKAIPIAGALDMGLITPDERFDCENGRWLYGGAILRDAHPYGILSVSQIIQKSSNIGTAKIALKMGEDRLDNIFKRFEFGKTTGIQIPTEATGIYRKRKNWDRLSITRFPIGQGIMVSCLQIVRAYCAIANGGYLLNLRIIDRETNPITKETFYFKTEAPKKIFARSDTRQKIVDMLKLVTKKGGTAERAAIKGYETAGKTGTAQKVIDGHYSNSKFCSSFIGFAPADDPAFLMLIMLDEPQGTYYGGIVSAESFKIIGEKILKIFDVPPQFIEEYEMANSASSNEKENN